MNIRLIALLGPFALAALPGCYVDVHENTPDDVDYVAYEERGWDKLGSKRVDGRGKIDRDTIALRGRERRVDALLLVVRRAPVDLRDVVVTFEDGSTYQPHLRHVMEEGARSYEIHLPPRGEVDTISFRYANLPGEGSAVIEVWGH